MPRASVETVAKDVEAVEAGAPELSRTPAPFDELAAVVDADSFGEGAQFEVHSAASPLASIVFGPSGKAYEPREDDDGKEDEEETEGEAGSAGLCAPFAVAGASGCSRTCTFQNLTLPKSPNVVPYCHWVKLGYIGFHWPLADVSAAEYSCPQGSWFSTNGEGLGFCIFDVDPLPTDPSALEASCEHLLEGSIAYSVPKSLEPGHARFCPTSATEHASGCTNSCSYDAVPLPKAASLTPYCHWVKLGYVGFHWSLADVSAAEYSCPQGSWFSTNGEGLGFCIFDVDPLPTDPSTLESNCEKLASGSFGYSFSTAP